MCRRSRRRISGKTSRNLGMALTKLLSAGVREAGRVGMSVVKRCVNGILKFAANHFAPHRMGGIKL